MPSPKNAHQGQVINRGLPPSTESQCRDGMARSGYKLLSPIKDGMTYEQWSRLRRKQGKPMRRQLITQ